LSIYRRSHLEIFAPKGLEGGPYTFGRAKPYRASCLSLPAAIVLVLVLVIVLDF
jgi:hypothetical protein